MNEFWMVWNENANAPRVKHYTLEAAETEAERLARYARGQEFFVLQAVGRCVVKDVEWDRPQQKDDDICF